MTWLGLNDNLAWSLLTVAACGILSLFVSFQVGIFTLGAIVLAWWVWQHEEGGLILFLVVSAILPMLKITQTVGTATLLKDVIIFTLLYKVLLVPLFLQKLPYRRNIFLGPILALGFISLVQVFRADVVLLGLLRARDIGLYVLLYLVVLYMPHTYGRMRRRLAWLFYSFWLVLGLAVYQWFFAVDSAVLRFDPVREIWIPRLSSVMAHPSIFGQYLVIAAALFVSVGIFAPLKRIRLLAFGIFAAELPFIYLTYSRAVWIGLLAALAVMAVSWFFHLLGVRHFRSLQLWTWGVGFSFASMLFLLLLLSLTPIGGFVRSAIDPTYGSNVERLEFLTRLVAPTSNVEAIFGRGLGDVLSQNFRTVDVEVFDLASGSVRVVQQAKNRTLVDNQHLKTWVEMGLIGLVVYAWVYWRFVSGSFVLLMRSQPVASILGLWGLGFVCAFILQGFFIDIWEIFPTNAWFWIIAALVSAYHIPMGRGQNPR